MLQTNDVIKNYEIITKRIERMDDSGVPVSFALCEKQEEYFQALGRAAIRVLKINNMDDKIAIVKDAMSLETHALITREASAKVFINIIGAA